MRFSNLLLALAVLILQPVLAHNECDDQVVCALEEKGITATLHGENNQTSVERRSTLKMELTRALDRGDVLEVAMFYVMAKDKQQFLTGCAVSFGFLAAGCGAAAAFTLGTSLIGAAIAGPACISTGVEAQQFRRQKQRAKKFLKSRLTVTKWKELRNLRNADSAPHVRMIIEGDD